MGLHILSMECILSLNGKKMGQRASSVMHQSKCGNALQRGSSALAVPFSPSAPF